MDIFEKKEKVRQLASESAKNIDPKRAAEQDVAILRRLSDMPELRESSSVFCYVSMDSEVDTRKLLPALLNSGRRVFVPRIDGENMVAVEIRSTDELAPGAFGIPEPAGDLPATPAGDIELALVPGVAFGEDGTRVGRGKGYYDRWLANFRGTKVALVREDELRPSVPTDEHDARMNAIITDTRTLRISTASKTMEATIEQSVAKTVKEEASEVAADSRKTAQNRGHKPKRRLGCAGALIWMLIVIGVSAALAGIGWICADDLLGLTAADKTAMISVERGDEVKDVANKLKDAEMIKHPWLFDIFGWVFDAEEKIAPGVYEVNAMMDYRALINAMRENSNYRATVEVTIPEGFTVEQIITRLAENGVCDYDELKDTCANYDFEYSFLADRPFGDANRLEGYLFPNTHTFYVGENPVNAINRMLSDFSKKFDEDLRAEAAEAGYSMHEVLTIASLIEKEAASREEMALISSVIHNRLNNWDHPLLQIDASIQYALPERKEHLSSADLAIDSPYNTYRSEGLPPGPICNPGLAAIRAALRPSDTNYYFYALTEDGTHEFVRTAEEHAAIIAANPGVYGGE